MSTKKTTTSSRKTDPKKDALPKKGPVIEGVAKEVSEDTAVKETSKAAADTKGKAAAETKAKAAAETKETVKEKTTSPKTSGDAKPSDTNKTADTTKVEREDYIEEVTEEYDHHGRAGWYAAAALAFMIGGAGLFAYAAPWLSRNLPESLAAYVRPGGEATDARLAALEGNITTLEGSVSTLGNSIDPSSAEPQTALTGRLDTLEGKIALFGEQSGTSPEINAQIKALEAAVARNAEAAKAVDIKPVLTRIAQIEAALKEASDDGSSGTAALAAISAEVSALGTQVKALAPQIEAVRQEAEAMTAKNLAEAEQNTASLDKRLGVLERDESGKAASRAIALAGLSSAVQRGNFSAELSTFKTLNPDAMSTPALDALAVAGLPGIAGLQADYQDSLHTALKAENTLDDSASWSDQLFGKALNVVTVRPVGEIAGTSTSAILARGEVRVQAGDIAAALSELKGLKGPAKDAMAGWISKARARTSALDELEKLKQSSLAAMSGATN